MSKVMRREKVDEENENEEWFGHEKEEVKKNRMKERIKILIYTICLFGFVDRVLFYFYLF